ncbi:MAG: amidophosphoribosyltransferase [Firmicutes bacterium]|nr:amidophosphoribosyltransferase [Bacillota bacterium]
MAELSGAPREACGIFAVWNHPDPVGVVLRGLYALQHRGQESAGMAVRTPSGELVLERGMGLVAEALPAERLERLRALGPDAALGHVRYSTTGASRLENAQPFLVRLRQGASALAHNGELVNAARLRRTLERRGSIFQSESDSEVIAHLVAARPEGEVGAAFLEALHVLQGAFALALLAPSALWAVRDPYGIRPLTLGRLGKATVVASESCALDAVGAEPLGEVRAGEAVEIGTGGLRRLRYARPEEGDREALCLFELIYLARPDTLLAGGDVHTFRKRSGRLLAREAPAEADVVVGVPDSSLSAASGYAEALGLPYEMGLVRNRYVGRTFIEPEEAGRGERVRLKLNAVRPVVAGRRVVLVDDSLVRGTTARQIVELLRSAGAAQVHLRIASPPFRFPCGYGIDASRRGELFAAGRSLEAMRAELGVESLAFLSLAGLLEAAGEELPAGSAPASRRFCTACFTGDYPVPLPDREEAEEAPLPPPHLEEVS